MTSFLYSLSKSNVKKGIPRRAATRMASRRSSLQLHSIQSGCQTFIKTPVTLYPSFFSMAAETELSTPPDMPTNTFLPDPIWLTLFMCRSYHMVPDLVVLMMSKVFISVFDMLFECRCIMSISIAVREVKPIFCFSRIDRIQYGA